jgi:hypothetical protein
VFGRLVECLEKGLVMGEESRGLLKWGQGRTPRADTLSVSLFFTSNKKRSQAP